jgi:hypothetical protein
MSAAGLSVPELFQVKPPDDGSKAYGNLFEARSERAAHARALCEDIWRDFHDLADRQFSASLTCSKTCNSSSGGEALVREPRSCSPAGEAGLVFTRSPLARHHVTFSIPTVAGI